MRRVLYPMTKSSGQEKNSSPIVIEVEPVAPEIVEKEELMPFVISHEEEIINHIKEKAVKETMNHLAPLLEKLEEAVQQQQAVQEAQAASAPGGLIPGSQEDRLKNLQEIFRKKELKVAERLSQLQARFAGVRR
ncbi:hypothetical protein [Chryseobacterium camelliae]|uniref:hypothetical protein n=1 Tax=Chryseobacterium camelliae TaxID=1265445 RepID=UPI00285A0F6C|nr:hypothetical protein [Chryseobacterium camelliae]MDR6514459.1 hypothetical protein [Chryseobacterium camelliae]